MKTKILILLFVIAGSTFMSCHPKYISFRTKTRNTLELYKKVVNGQSSYEEFYDFYCNKDMYGKKKYRKNRNIPRSGYNLLVQQKELIMKVEKYKQNYFGANFTGRNCSREKTMVLVRELIEPTTFYSYLSSIHRGESYVFYFLYDYDPATGLGMYFQSDAFYPRDAFSFSSNDLCADSGRIEFYNGIFMLTHSDYMRKDVICLMGAQNDMNDRKEFEISIVDSQLTLTKRYEYKIYNYYPIIQGNYTIQTKGILQRGETTKTLFQREFDALDKLVEEKAASASKFMQQKVDSNGTVTVNFRDYLYPCKSSPNVIADSGWVYFGRKQDKFVINETFFRYQRSLFVMHKEIRKHKQLENIRVHNLAIRPLDVIKIRDTIPTKSDHPTNFTDPAITGEASSGISYLITDTANVHEGDHTDIWMKIKKK